MPDVAMATDVNLIEIALDGRTDLLAIVFGSGKRTKGKAERKKGVTGPQFKAFVARINERRQGKRDG